MDMTNLVIFGGTGDLAMRKLMPALFYMHRDGKLATGSRILCVARGDLTQEDFLKTVHDALKKYLPATVLTADLWEGFQTFLSFLQFDIQSDADWKKLQNALTTEQADNIIYYMAVPPTLFGTICAQIKAHQLNPEHARIVVEKPLGEDLKTAQQINGLISSAFAEDRIYRIDHYLGKTAVQNLLSFRFDAPEIEKIWSADYIENIQITVSESIGVEGRFDFLDKVGVLRDMVQNHVMQLLALVAMDKPASRHADDIRDEKAKVIGRLTPAITDKNIAHHIVRAQYTGGEVNKLPLAGYQDEVKGHAAGTGETYIAAKTYIDTPRWQNMPFYLRTGKRLSARYITITVIFKDKVTDAIKEKSPLVLHIQPDIHITPNIWQTQFFQGTCPLNPARLNGQDNGDKRMADAYETLLLDVIHDNPAYFVRRDEIEASWKWVDAVRQAWGQENLPMAQYPSGSFGPKAAEQILENGHHWYENT